MATLIEMLCFYFDCKPSQLPNHLLPIERLLQQRRLRTIHLKGHNKTVACGGLTFQGASDLKAFRGKHGLTVTQYYFAKYKKDLSYPGLPCVIEYGGKGHKSYFPLEVLSIDM